MEDIRKNPGRPPAGQEWYFIGYLHRCIQVDGEITVNDWQWAVEAAERAAQENRQPNGADNVIQLYSCEDEA
jgi:hypothetical protein